MCCRHRRPARSHNCVRGSPTTTQHNMLPSNPSCTRRPGGGRHSSRRRACRQRTALVCSSSQGKSLPACLFLSVHASASCPRGQGRPTRPVACARRLAAVPCLFVRATATPWRGRGMRVASAATAAAVPACMGMGRIQTGEPCRINPPGPSVRASD